MAQGFLQIAIFCALIVAVVPLLGGHMARVFRGERTFLDPVAGPLERVTYRLLRIDPAARPGLEGLRPQRDPLLARGLARALRHPAHADAAPLQPGELPLRHVGRVVQHRLVVRDQHELAVLRRRDDALLLQPDGGTDRPELRLGGHRHRGGHRAHPRHHRPPQRDADARQLLAGPRPGHVLRAAADLDRRRGAARLAGRPADARGHGRRPRARPGRLPGGDQGARHQRRRLLQRQLVLSVRERHRPLEPHRAVPHPLHPRLADLHLRAHGRQPPAGVGDLRGHVDALHRQRRRRLPRRAARHAGPARRRHPHRGDRRLDRRQHGGQGRPLRHRELDACGRR